MMIRIQWYISHKTKYSNKKIPVLKLVTDGRTPGGGVLVQWPIRERAAEMGLKSASWYTNDNYSVQNWYKHGSYF